MVLIRGVNLNLHPIGEALSDHIRRENDFFEAEILDFIRDNFPTHGTILDVGANIGNHSAYFANFLNYRQIVAFEPVPENYVLLVQNCAYYNGFYPFKWAVTDKDTSLRISPKFDNMGASFVNREGTLEVVGVPLDNLSLYDVTLLKIDVEWHEPEVLAGARALIEKNRPLILIEDTKDEYADLFPNYRKIKGWPQHGTYLYRWNV